MRESCPVTPGPAPLEQRGLFLGFCPFFKKKKKKIRISKESIGATPQPCEGRRRGGVPAAVARRGVVPDAVPTAGGLGTMGWPQWDAATRSWHRAHGAAKPGNPGPQQGAWGGDPLNPPRLGVRVAPLWHWDLTDHHCGIIVPFQPHEQKQGPEPPAVGTRGQRDTPMVPSPPPQWSQR